MVDTFDTEEYPSKSVTRVSKRVRVKRISKPESFSSKRAKLVSKPENYSSKRAQRVSKAEYSTLPICGWVHKAGILEQVVVLRGLGTHPLRNAQLGCRISSNASVCLRCFAAMVSNTTLSRQANEFLVGSVTCAIPSLLDVELQNTTAALCAMLRCVGCC